MNTPIESPAFTPTSERDFPPVARQLPRPMKVLVVIRVTGVGLMAAVLSACASVSVKNLDSGQTAKPAAKPKVIYVAPFSIANAKVKENPMRKNPGKLSEEAQTLVAQALVQELSAHVAPARFVASASKAGRDGWLLSGDITRLEEGSRILRMALGLGFGGTKLETKVEVRNASASNPPFLKFSTTGGSGATPGGATNPIPFSGVPTAIWQGQQGVTDDSKRTARMITAAVADYMVNRGWLAPGTVQKPKMGTSR